jgi:hypothetical protein
MNWVYPRRKYQKTIDRTTRCTDCGEFIITETWRQAWYKVVQMSCKCGSFKHQESA